MNVACYSQDSLKHEKSIYLLFGWPIRQLLHSQRIRVLDLLGQNSLDICRIKCSFKILAEPMRILILKLEILIGSFGTGFATVLGVSDCTIQLSW